MKKLRIVALTGLPAAMAVAACGSLLGINDRELDDTPDGSNRDSGPGVDGEVVLVPAEASIPPVPGAKCAEGPCASVNGTCVDGGVCSISCTKKGSCQPVVCPPDIDCELDCAKNDGCKDVTCSGGRSCTLRCGGAGSCEDAKCTGADTICRFECNAPDNACKDSSCDAKECSFLCAGKHACEDLNGVAVSTCLIDCTDESTCRGASNTCNGADSRINCTGPGKDTCSGTASCQPTAAQQCTIQCLGDGCAHCCDEDASAGNNCKFLGNIDGTKNCKK